MRHGESNPPHTSDKRVARAEHMLKFRKWTLQFFRMSILHAAAKNDPEASEVAHLPREITTDTRHGINNDDSFTKRDFKVFQNVVHVD